MIVCAIMDAVAPFEYHFMDAISMNLCKSLLLQYNIGLNIFSILRILLIVDGNLFSSSPAIPVRRWWSFYKVLLG